MEVLLFGVRPFLCLTTRDSFHVGYVFLLFQLNILTMGWQGVVRDTFVVCVHQHAGMMTRIHRYYVECCEIYIFYSWAVFL